MRLRVCACDHRGIARSELATDAKVRLNAKVCCEDHNVAKNIRLSSAFEPNRGK